VGATAVPGAGVAGKAAPALGRQAYVQIPPVELFGSSAITLRGHLDAVVLVESHTAAETQVSTIPAKHVAARMAASLREERERFLTHYRHFQFAFPTASSAVVDKADASEARLITRRLAGRPAIRVVHPYPCDIADLGATVRKAALEALATTRQGRDAEVRELRS
jgi:hypothetical protein